MIRAIPPVPDRDSQFFWDGVAQGRLLLRRCSECSRLQHPPSPMCPNCGSVHWDIEEVSGRGVVASWIVSRHPSEPEGDGRIVAVVELAEGVRLVSNLCDVDPAQVANGMAVAVKFDEIGGVKLPQFRPAEVRS